MTMIAFGLGRRFPKAPKLRVKLLSRIMFNGDPCPIKSTGIFLVIVFTWPEKPHKDGAGPKNIFNRIIE
jgi:hypothetical protein